MWLYRFSIILISVNNVMSQCDPGWYPFGESCYHIARDPESWGDAMEFCRLEGGALAEINTDMEQKLMEQELADPKWHVNGITEYWLGGTDWAVEGKWIWEASKLSVTYTNWAANEPNNGGLVEHCMCTDRTELYMWRDEYCADKLLYICEKRITPTQAPIIG